MRFLSESEKTIFNNENQSPLVIEPNKEITSANYLDYFNTNSEDIRSMVTKYGAVLFRGFDIQSEKDFEHAMNKIDGLVPINDYFMSEPGRTLIEGSKSVFYTNKIYKTGGALYFGGFHTENHYTCDVPNFISFYCRKPSLFGGETGLVNMGKVFEELNTCLKQKLAEKTFLTITFRIADIAKRYNVADNIAKAICTEFGLTSQISSECEEFISLYKPSIIDHPISNTPALIGNLSAEIVGLDRALFEQFKDSYAGLKWTFHRFAWKHTILVALNQATWGDIFAYIVKSLRKKSKPIANEEIDSSSAERLLNAFSKTDVDTLAILMRKHFTSFKWKKGDILLIDNLQMVHAGLPGFGTRILRTMLSNPVPMNYSCSGEGHQSVNSSIHLKSLADIFKHVNKPIEDNPLSVIK